MKNTPSLRATRFAHCVRTAIETVQLAADARGVKIDARLEKIGLVRMDLDCIQQIVWNLLANAVKFTPARAEDRSRALAAGFDEHMAKPAEADRLLALVERLARAARG